VSQQTIDLDQALKVSVQAAREAGAILLEESKRPQKVSYKGDVDLVTQADVRSERSIAARLREAFPDHRIVGEELGDEGAKEEASRYRWLVDPLDGTTNFAHGFPVFAVSIGLLENDEPVVGAVYHPSTDEMFSARRGGGAFLNDQPIHVSSVTRLAGSLMGTGFPTHKRSETPNLRYYWEFTLRSHGVRRAGAAALDLCSVACGRFEAFWEFGLKPWDTAAGILLVREAGGRVTDFDGRPYHPGDRILTASNGLIHEEMCGVARQIAAEPRVREAKI
jgi:myo-inositol-1(or 4)-monophosphatase